MARIKSYSTTAASNTNAATGVNFDENQLPSTVNDSARTLMSDIRAWYEDVEWRDWGHTVTRTANTTFTIATDVTAIYVANRQIRCADSSTLYGYIASSSYSAPNTTVTVTLDSGNLSASLTAVALGLDPSKKSIDVSSVRNAVSTASATTFTDNLVTIADNSDATKKFKFDAANVTASNTRTLGVPDADTTLVGQSDAASQAEMEAASSTVKYLSPGRAKYHPGVAKVWAYVTVSGGTPTLAAGENVSGITDHGTGDFSVNFNTNFSSANYASIVCADDSSTAFTAKVISKSTSAVRVNIGYDNPSGDNQALFDGGFSIVCFGDQ